MALTAVVITKKPDHIVDTNEMVQRRKVWMKTLRELINEKKIIIMETSADGGYGYLLPSGYRNPRSLNDAIMVIFSWGGGWDHVSAGCEGRCCSWEEMCTIKDIFFREDECVIQYHPSKKDYVNNHPYVLHLWRPQNEILPMPPKIMV